MKSQQSVIYSLSAHRLIERLSYSLCFSTKKLNTINAIFCLRYGKSANENVFYSFIYNDNLIFKISFPFQIIRETNTKPPVTLSTITMMLRSQVHRSPTMPTPWPTMPHPHSRATSRTSSLARKRLGNSRLR